MSTIKDLKSELGVHIVTLSDYLRGYMEGAETPVLTGSFALKEYRNEEVELYAKYFYDTHQLTYDMLISEKDGGIVTPPLPANQSGLSELVVKIFNTLEFISASSDENFYQIESEYNPTFIDYKATYEYDQTNEKESYEISVSSNFSKNDYLKIISKD